MTSLSFAQILPFPRYHQKTPLRGTLGLMLFTDNKSQNKWVLSTSNHGNEASVANDSRAQQSEVIKKKRTKRIPTSGRKKATVRSNNEPHILASDPISEHDSSSQEEGKGDSERPKKKSRRVMSNNSSGTDKATSIKVLRKGRKSKKDLVEVKDGESEAEASSIEEPVYLTSEESDDAEIDLELEKGNRDDISFSYSWPPLVCCFGASQHAFVPSGRPANRLIDHEIHDSLKDALWAPEKFVRAPGGSAGGVAVALAKVGGRVAFMGKIGDDDFGKTMLYFLNVNNVQTRSVCLDDKRSTAVSHMRLTKRGNLRAISVKPCAEDSLSKSEINIDVLKEAKMFYVSTSSFLDVSMRRTTLRAIKIAKKLGQMIFYDLNLPLPLWQSSDETKTFILEAWNLAEIIEVTRQELEFLCGIKPSEEFDTKNNKQSKFAHYESDIIAPLWHENLKVVFVSNGTSKIHYYTKEHNGCVLGVEDAPVTPFTQEMSASGDGIVAALMRMLTMQPDLVTDKGYLERAIRYAISCGVIDQWIVARQRGFPATRGMEEDDDDEDEAIPDPNGIRSITEKEFRTVMPVAT